MPDSGEEFVNRLAGFTAALRHAGVRVGIGQGLTFASTFARIDATNRRQFYCAGRTTLVSRYEDLVIFDEVFEEFWRPSAQVGVSPEGRRSTPRTINTRPSPFFVAFMRAQLGRHSDVESDISSDPEIASWNEALHRRDFATFTEAELVEVSRVLGLIQWDALMRRTRRQRPARRGPRIDLRRALRLAARNGGAVSRLPRLERKTKPRPVVLLADISGSMQLYSRVVLQFFHGFRQALKQSEAFVFGTRLTRITEDLVVRDVDRAVAGVSRRVPDFSGGTRIADALGAFNAQWSRRTLKRGAVVIVISDGWEQGSSAALAREMRRLHRHCFRLIWLNPRLGAKQFEPVTGGMAAALPYIDDFLPINNLESLGDLAAHLGGLHHRPGIKPTSSSSHRRESASSFTSHPAWRPVDEN